MNQACQKHRNPKKILSKQIKIEKKIRTQRTNKEHQEHASNMNQNPNQLLTIQQHRHVGNQSLTNNSASFISIIHESTN